MHGESWGAGLLRHRAQMQGSGRQASRSCSLHREKSKKGRAAIRDRVSLDVAEVLHLVLISLFGDFALVLLALQMLPELHFFAGPSVAHGAVELAAGGDTHGEVTRYPLTGTWVEVRTWRKASKQGIFGIQPTRKNFPRR